MKTVSKSSFTLFELLIVILIISIIYGLFIERISTKKTLHTEDSIKEIPKILSSLDFNKSTSILCTDKCKECSIVVDGEAKEQIDLFDAEVVVYDFDINGILSPRKFTPIFDKNGNPKEICFRFDLYPNRSHSSYIVEYKEKFYIFYAYMRPPKVADTITEASELFDPTQWIPVESSQYNF